MSEFDNLKGDAEKYAQDHPQQVHEAEQDAEHAAESKVGFGGEQGQDNQQDQNDQNNQQNQNNQQGQDAGQANQGQ